MGSLLTVPSEIVDHSVSIHVDGLSPPARAAMDESCGAGDEGEGARDDSAEVGRDANA